MFAVEAAYCQKVQKQELKKIPGRSLQGVLSLRKDAHW